MIASRFWNFIFIILTINFSSCFGLTKSSHFELSEIYLTQQNPNQSAQVISWKKMNDFSENNQLLKTNLIGTTNLTVFTKNQLHPIWGFGGSVTEACMSLIAKEPSEVQSKIMEALFDKDRGAGLNFLRIPIGANDFSNKDYTLNDLSRGERDPELHKMNFEPLNPTIDFIKSVKALNPNVGLMITPWTPPSWMKTTDKFNGGKLKQESFPYYADYIQRTLEYIETESNLKVKFLTAMNEPLIGEAKSWWFFPQGYLSIDDQFHFTKDYLIPMLKSRSDGVHYPKLLLHDHNWGNSMETVERFDSELFRMNSGIAGVAMHCYGGDFSTQIAFHKRWPKLATFNTECTANIHSNYHHFDFQWWLQSQSLDATQIGSRGALGWNLCLDQKGGPRNNGCSDCRGLITINSEKHEFTLNPEYYALAQVSKFINKSSNVVDHDLPKSSVLKALTFKNSDESLYVIVRNPTKNPEPLNIQIDHQFFDSPLMIPAYSAVSLRYKVNN